MIKFTRYPSFKSLKIGVIPLPWHLINNQTNEYTMKQTTLITYLFLLILTIWAQSIVAQRDIPVGDFDGISVIGNIDVTLEAGEPGTVSLYAEGIPEDDISIKVSRGTLRLKVTNSWLYSNEIIRIYVPYQTLRLIRADAGATITSRDTLKTEVLEVNIGSGAVVTLAVDVESLKASANEGGKLTLMGRTVSQDVGAGTGGVYDAFDLDCQRTYVRVGTGGQAEVVAIELLEASANTGGSIIYQGEPKQKVIKTFIAGEVEAF